MYPQEFYVLQEVEAEEDRLWRELIQAAKGRVSSEKERYRKVREVRFRIIRKRSSASRHQSGIPPSPCTS